MSNDEQGSHWGNFWMALLLAVVGVPLCIGVVDSIFDRHVSIWGRPADGPGGYLDRSYNQQLNLSQTGVHDRQIPLAIRQDYARKIGVSVPQEYPDKHGGSSRPDGTYEIKCEP